MTKPIYFDGKRLVIISISYQIAKTNLNLKIKGFQNKQNEKFSHPAEFCSFFSYSKLSPQFGSKATRDPKFAFEPSTEGQEGQYNHDTTDESHHRKFVHAGGRPLVAQRHILIVRDLLHVQVSIIIVRSCKRKFSSREPRLKTQNIEFLSLCKHPFGISKCFL